MLRAALMPALAFGLLGPAAARCAELSRSCGEDRRADRACRAATTFLGGSWPISSAGGSNQSFVVENRPGGGTIVGTKAVIAAEPDGYTLLVGGLSNIVFNAGLYKKLPYDPLKDLVPVALILNISYTLVGSPTLPYKTPKEIIAAAKANPGSDQARQCRRRHRPARGRRGVPGHHRNENA